MPVSPSLVFVICAGCAATSLASPASLGPEGRGQGRKFETIQFYRGDDQLPSDRFRPDDGYRRYDDRDRRYDDRSPRDDRGRDDRGRDDRRRDDRGREGGRGGQGAQQLAQQIRDAQTRHNQGVVALQQQFNQRQISRPQMDAGIRQLEVQMNGEIARAQEAQRR